MEAFIAHPIIRTPNVKELYKIISGVLKIKDGIIAGAVPNTTRVREPKIS